MHLWRKLVTRAWLARNEIALNKITRGKFAVIEIPTRKRVTVECACDKIEIARELRRKFGGTVRRLPSDWLRRALRKNKTRPIRIGKRALKIPASAAFGTGEHETTALCLRLLAETSKSFSCPWRLLDLGTGSGILALAAKLLGAREVLAIDNDPIALRVAKHNARPNRIRGIEFKIGDALRWQDRDKKFDVITANLFSELLIKALPILRKQLRQNGRLVLSGILRREEARAVRALRRQRLSILQIRRRGKWIAILAQ